MNETIQVSPLRLRIGVLCIFLWWAPFWALGPVIAETISMSVTTVTFIIMAVQTIIGVLGILIAGKQVLSIMKTVPRRKLLKTVWRVLVHGSFEQQV